MKQIEYKYNEEVLVNELKQYIDKTYVNITQKISFRQLNLLLIVVMEKDSVLVTL